MELHELPPQVCVYKGVNKIGLVESFIFRVERLRDCVPEVDFEIGRMEIDFAELVETRLLERSALSWGARHLGADLLIGEGQSRLGQEDRLDRAPLLGVRHPLGRSCENPHGYRPGGDNISEPLAVDRPRCGRDLPLRE